MGELTKASHAALSGAQRLEHSKVFMGKLQQEADCNTRAAKDWHGISVQGGGGMVQCCFGRCARAFHILCARQDGNVVALRAADAMLLCFCKLHSAERFAKTRGQMVEEVPEGFEAASALPEEAIPGQPNEYEAQRERNIARNKLRLAELLKA